jgi:hypothetical protein
MDIKTFVNVVSNLPCDISILAKGPTGIGKSYIFHQIGKNVGLPVIDRRLSQLQEGDIIGLPQLADGVTRFAPVDWFIRACKEPVVLFFDELNRASMEVQQCAFQIILDRELNGHKLHPETRIYSAINEGSEYQVLDMDPALLRRFWVADLEPTTEDWLEWAETCDDIGPMSREYIRKYPAHLRHAGQLEPGKVYPSPASWHRLLYSLKNAGMSPEDCAGTNLPSIFYSMCTGFIGMETSIAFSDFVRNYQTKFYCEDVTKNWDNKKAQILKIGNDKKNDLIEQIVVYTKNNELLVNEVMNITDFVKSCSDEMIVNFFNMIMETQNIDNIRKLHRTLGKCVTDIVNASDKY